VEKCPEARRLKTHPGVGPLTALALILIIGRADRFQCGKQVTCYLGLVPLEDSSGERRRLGHITKQGNSLLRFLLVEAAQVTARSLPEWRSKYCHPPTASLPPPPFQLLPGGANQFPGGSCTR
jgi:transposase